MRYQSVVPSFDSSFFPLSMGAWTEVGPIQQGPENYLLTGSPGYQKWSVHGEIQGRSITIAGTGSRPEWLEATLRGIEQVSGLEDNWDSYGGKRVSLSSVIHGLELVLGLLANNSMAPIVFATSNGGIQFEWHTNEVNLEIEVTPDGRKLVYREDIASGDEWETEVNGDLRPLQDAVAMLQKTSIPA
jgi:hypothetical protein